MHNLIFISGDTDGLKFCKKDMSPYSQEEVDFLLKEINSMLPDKIRLDFDGWYESICILKSKNYFFLSEGKKKLKGSSITDQKKEPALLEMIGKITDALLDHNIQAIQDIYSSYIIEANNVTDINRWATKRTVTKSVLNPERTNEQKLFDALAGEPIREGDKVWVYFTSEDNLELVQNWTNNESKSRLTKRVYDTLNIFSEVIDIKQYPKYHLKGQQNALQILLDSVK